MSFWEIGAAFAMGWVLVAAWLWGERQVDRAFEAVQKHAGPICLLIAAVLSV